MSTFLLHLFPSSPDLQFRGYVTSGNSLVHTSTSSSLRVKYISHDPKQWNSFVIFFSPEKYIIMGQFSMLILASRLNRSLIPFQNE